jgi:hypothetical protein
MFTRKPVLCKPGRDKVGGHWKLKTFLCLGTCPKNWIPTWSSNKLPVRTGTVSSFKPGSNQCNSGSFFLRDSVRFSLIVRRLYRYPTFKYAFQMDYARIISFGISINFSYMSLYEMVGRIIIIFSHWCIQFIVPVRVLKV